MTVCERIDKILKENKISRRQLAMRAGIATSSFQSAMERNSTLSLEMLLPICRVLGVSSRELTQADYAIATIDIDSYESISWLADQWGKSVDEAVEFAVDVFVTQLGDLGYLDQDRAKDAYRSPKFYSDLCTTGMLMRRCSEETERELQLLKNLNEDGIKKLCERIDELASIPKYTKPEEA